MSFTTIAFLSDFGLQDPFVGIVEGVIARIAPQARVIHLTHDIPPGDVRRASVVLWQSLPYFPADTIFLAVVDPGVGTARRPIVAEHNGQRFIGPDNGLFSLVLPEGTSAWALENPVYQLPRASSTFHGRDIFAPAAAHCANGIAPAAFGAALPQVQRLPRPHLNPIGEHALQAEVLLADRFGNLLTSFGHVEMRSAREYHLSPWLPESAPEVIFNPVEYALHLPDGRALAWVNTFAEAPTGECAALIGSSGLIEIVANHKSAAELLQLRDGALLEFKPISK